MQEQTQINITYKIVCEQYRKTSQKKKNVSKQQFKNFEISAEEISFQIMSFCFQL